MIIANYCSMSAESQGALLAIAGQAHLGDSDYVTQQYESCGSGVATWSGARRTSNATMEHVMPRRTRQQHMCFLWVRPEAI
jgi:hypothetical protein